MKRDKSTIYVLRNNHTELIAVFLLLTILFITSCISPYIPDYEGNDEFVVVDGSLIKGNEEQIISLSYSSSISGTKYQDVRSNPIGDCIVKVVDDSGNEFIFTEKEPGKYVANIDDNLLSYTSSYKLEFRTPLGEYYESDFQELMETAPVDSIYYLSEYNYDSDLEENNVEGYQFYFDLNAPVDASPYYKIQIEETWETRSLYKISGIYEGNSVKLNDWPEDSIYYCWTTELAEGIYTASTAKQSDNIIKKVPLHFRKLSAKQFGIKYCATIKQYALNKDAYDYWHQRDLELTESDQIYSNQPSQIESNITNINNPSEKVLGYFWVSSSAIKRLFLEKGEGGEFPDDCDNIRIPYGGQSKEEMESQLLKYILNQRRPPAPPPPLYIYYVCNLSSCSYFVGFSDDCIDCRNMGGINKKPDFWGSHPSDLPY